MRVTLAHDDFNQKHLDKVIAEMKILGRPSIRVYEIEEGWYQAIEGCHRLRACEILNIRPKIIILDQDTPIIDNTNTQIIDWDGPTINVIGELGAIDNYTIKF